MEILTNILGIFLIICGLLGIAICTIAIGKIIIFIQMEEYENLQKEKEKENNQKQV